MRVIIEVILAIIFNTTISIFSLEIKKESLQKAHKGLPSLEKFTQQLTE